MNLEGEIFYREKLQQAAAHRAVRRALRRGKLEQKPCLECGAEQTEAHHAFGYELRNRLRVEWLCRRHHRRVHPAGGYPADSVDNAGA